MKHLGRPRLQRAQFYAILDTAYVARDRWAQTCEGLIAGGADLIQVRAKTETPAVREELLREIMPLFAGPEENRHDRGPFVIVNDDVELCASVPGVGLHIGQDDMPAKEARHMIGPDRIMGLSTHSWKQAMSAQKLEPGIIDYFCVGPVFTTRTKPDYAAVGLELIRKVARSAPRLPWFAIGGINRTTVAEVISAGADRIVVVSDVLTDPHPASVIQTLVQRLPSPIC